MKFPYIDEIARFFQEDPAYAPMPDESGIWAEMMLQYIISVVNTTNPDISE